MVQRPEATNGLLNYGSDGGTVTDYKLEGAYLKDRQGHRIGQIDGKYVRDSRGIRVGEIAGNVIRDARGLRVAQIDGVAIRDASGGRIGNVDDVRELIDGPGGASLVALWLLLLR